MIFYDIMFYQAVRCLTATPREVSKPWDMTLKISGLRDFLWYYVLPIKVKVNSLDKLSSVKIGSKYHALHNWNDLKMFFAKCRAFLIGNPDGISELIQNLVLGKYFQRHGAASILKAHLTHWDRDKMATIFQTTFSNAFSWMKMYRFQFRIHSSLFPRVQLTIFQHWFR